jgi:RimJ/RimL family protein N-acetyltransferase
MSDPESPTTPAYRIETPRLVIRCWNPADAPLLSQSVSESIEHLKPWMPWAHNEPTPLQTRIDRLRLWRSKFDLDQDYSYGIFNPEETRVLGGTGLHPRVGPDATEIGYWIHVDFAGQGLATETSAALVRVVFEVLKLKRVEIRCAPANVRSAAVPRKLGFTHEATLARRIPHHTGILRDVMVWSLFEDQYPNSPAARAEVAAYDAAGRKIL